MKPVKHYPLRRIAESELTSRFGDLDDAVRNDLALSLVRQWLTNDGYAGLITPTRHFWFHLVTKGDSLEVGFTDTEGNWGLALARDWGVGEDEIPGILHRLNLCQSVVCRTGDNRALRLWIEAKAQAVRWQEQVGEEE
jgi:hypothetical protein